ncbi:unnamed protein product [Meloidogyne enterolobii]|uniref:Uncharacterized protein n=2 Tax=Meloidogyne enterolobii TaxID=390850 RepID=A0A6V7X212_MELEN|nr:unnamed protein product [Meloidogyne enterolobii]
MEPNHYPYFVLIPNDHLEHVINIGDIFTIKDLQLDCRFKNLTDCGPNNSWIIKNSSNLLSVQGSAKIHHILYRAREKETEGRINKIGNRSSKTKKIHSLWASSKNSSNEAHIIRHQTNFEFENIEAGQKILTTIRSVKIPNGVKVNTHFILPGNSKFGTKDMKFYKRKAHIITNLNLNL